MISRLDPKNRGARSRKGKNAKKVPEFDRKTGENRLLPPTPSPAHHLNKVYCRGRAFEANRMPSLSH